MRPGIGQFVLSESALHDLTAQPDEWLARPKEIEIELTDVKHLGFSISFRPEKGIISRIDRPACTIICACKGLPRLEVKFVVDQSCIRLFRDELAAALEQLRGP